eukprot:TRINITY_DN8908_c0_g1_i1.p3 TRINITY_DN8908_c0_g1~~TRINITY_DN8908_c0_g1_i1.p3  ORF type:complete len:91 (+),score=11.28 TRINITY_DN8908_c0_g1_i1:3-275(+)
MWGGGNQGVVPDGVAFADVECSLWHGCAPPVLCVVRWGTAGCVQRSCMLRVAATAVAGVASGVRLCGFAVCGAACVCCVVWVENGAGSEV